MMALFDHRYLVATCVLHVIVKCRHQGSSDDDFRRYEKDNTVCVNDAARHRISAAQETARREAIEVIEGGDRRRRWCITCWSH